MYIYISTQYIHTCIDVDVDVDVDVEIGTDIEVHVRMHACMFVSMYGCVYTWKQVVQYVCAHACMLHHVCACIYRCISIRISVSMFMCRNLQVLYRLVPHVCVYIYIYIYTYIHMYTHVYIYISAHIYIHSHMCPLSFLICDPQRSTRSSLKSSCALGQPKYERRRLTSAGFLDLLGGFEKMMGLRESEGSTKKRSISSLLLFQCREHGIVVAPFCGCRRKEAHFV